MEELLEIVLRMLVILFVSGILGLERELTGHKAGIRTLILVGIGSAGFIMTGYYLDVPDAELMRIMAGIATGIGFLGAGAIMKEGINVKGLTTAATIWVVSGIGIAIGLGSFTVGLTLFVLSLIVLSIFGIMERVLYLKPGSGILRICMEEGRDLPKNEMNRISKLGIVVKRMELERTRKGVCISLDLDIPKRSNLQTFIERMYRVKGVSKVEWEEVDGSSSYPGFSRP